MNCFFARRSFGIADSLVKTKANGGKAWGRTSMKFRAELEEVAAFLWDLVSRAGMDISGDVERTVEDDEARGGGFKKVVKRRQKFERSSASRHRDRLFVSETILDQVASEEMILKLTTQGEVGEGASRKRSVRVARGSIDVGNAESVDAKETVVIRLRRLEGGRAKIDYACDLEVGSFGASRSAVRQFVERRLEEVADISIFFQRLVPLKGYGVEDGQALGHDLIWKTTSAKKRVERLKEVLDESKALRGADEALPWVKAMMVPAVRGNLNMNRFVETKMACVSEKEAAQIGRNLVPALKSKKLIDAGIDQWRVQNRAVKQLMEKYDWFKPMVVVVGMGIVKAAPWGLVWRVSLGAMLSVLDLSTDLIVLHQFWIGSEEFKTYRNAQLASLAASVTCSWGLSLANIVKRRTAVGGCSRNWSSSAVE